MGWRTFRYAVLLAVLALHVFLLTALMLWRGSLRVAPPGQPLETTVLRPNRTRDHVIPPPFQTAPAPTKIDEPTIIFLPPSVGEGGFPAVNWAAEARRAADSAAKNEISPAPKARESVPRGNADWFPSSKYHAGDEVGLSNGDTAIFITDHCYQISPMIPVVTDALHTALKLHTFCKGGSKEPNGELFKDLDAYKKLHPESK
jgi:hypothetical protein